jgi:hypothetical protein
MTPQPFILGFCPMCQKPVQQSAVLDIAAPSASWKVICHAGAWVHCISAKDGIERIVYMAQAAIPETAAQRDELVTFPMRQHVEKLSQIKPKVKQ